jgi:BRCT domain type II-containing protein
MNKKKRKTISAAELSDHCLVFTGELKIPRKKVTSLVEKMGCRVQRSVTRETTLLVLGSQDEERLRPGHRRSLKHDAVKKRIKEGQDITILRQEEFYELIGCPVQLSLLDLVSKPTEGKAPPVQKITSQQRSRKKSKVRPDHRSGGALSRIQAPKQ